MADFTFGTIVPQPGAALRVETAGESLSIGDFVYLKSSDGKVWKADNDTSVATARVRGIVVYAAASADAPVCIQTGGALDPGATITRGPWFLSSNAAKMCPYSDLGTGDFQTQVGFASLTDELSILPVASGVALT